MNEEVPQRDIEGEAGRAPQSVRIDRVEGGRRHLLPRGDVHAVLVPRVGHIELS